MNKKGMHTHFLKHYRDYLPECYKRGDGYLIFTMILWFRRI